MYIYVCKSLFTVCIWQFAYSLRSTCNPKINTLGIFTVIGRHEQSGEKSEGPDSHIPSWGWTRRRSAFLFQLSHYKQASFSKSTKCLIFPVFVLYVGGFAVWNGPKHSTAVLPKVPKCEKAVTCFLESRCVFDELRLGIRYSAVGRELNVNESSTCSIRCLTQKYT